MISNTVLRDVERFVSSTIKDRTGKGPQLAKATMMDQCIHLELNGLLTKMELNFIESVGEDAYSKVEQTRMEMIRPQVQFYKIGIEEITSLKVEGIRVSWDARKNQCIARIDISEKQSQMSIKKKVCRKG